MPKYTHLLRFAARSAKKLIRWSYTFSFASGYNSHYSALFDLKLQPEYEKYNNKKQKTPFQMESGVIFFTALLLERQEVVGFAPLSMELIELLLV